MKKLFSIVLPIYGNEKNLPITIPYIIEHLDLFENYDVEIIMVNDGSPDNSWEIMKEYQKQYPELIRIAKLTRNFGQGASTRCGVEMARGDVVGIISADLQDPFELFKDMLTEWEKGHKFVLASRKTREEHGFIAFCSRTYHKLVKKYVNKRYPEGGFDFYIVDREIVDKALTLNFEYPFGQTILLWLGYDFLQIEYVRKKRQVGKSGYNFVSKFNLALKTFVIRSDVLLSMMLWAGLFMFLGGAVFGFADLILLLTGVINFNIVIDIFLLLCMFDGIILVAISVVGKCVWYTMEYTKNNPCFVVEEIIEESEKAVKL